VARQLKNPEYLSGWNPRNGLLVSIRNSLDAMTDRREGILKAIRLIGHQSNSGFLAMLNPEAITVYKIAYTAAD
jgi:hypothetical protein